MVSLMGDTDPRRSSRASLAYFAAAMFLVGMQMAETGASLERMTRVLSLTSAQQGYLVSIRFIGGLFVGLMLWAGHARVRFKQVLAASMILVAVSGPLLLVPSYASALIIAGLRGVSMGAVIPLSGMFAAAQRRWKPGQVAAAVNATLSAGLVLVSLFAAVLAATVDVRWEAYWAPASALALALLIVLPVVVFPRNEAPAEEPGQRSRTPVGRTSWSFAVAGLLLVGSEGTLLGLLPAQTAVAAPTDIGGELLALFLMSGVLAGRAAGTWLFRRFDTIRVLTVSLTAFVGAALAWTLAPALAPAMLFVLGCATANLFPGIISRVSHVQPAAAGATIAAIGWTGGLGGTLVPTLAGSAIDVGLPVRLLTLFVIMPTVGAYALARWGGARARSRPSGDGVDR
jgi:predicted MFS family arabinose efflux permease